MKQMNGKPSLTMALILLVIIILSVEPASAQSVPKPSVPEFTVQLTDRSYDVPISYSTDNYTGQTITHEGYRVVNKTIDVTIKNQQFSRYNDVNGNAINLYYNITAKGHFGGDLKYYPEYVGFQASDSAYTTITFLLNGDPFDHSLSLYAPVNGQIDFQVQAMVGYYHDEWISMNIPEHPLLGGIVKFFSGQTSDWSHTQTLKITQDVPSNSPTPTLTPTPTVVNPTATPIDSNYTAEPLTGGNQLQGTDVIPLTTFLLVVVVFAGIIAVLLVLLFRRQRNATNLL